MSFKTQDHDVMCLCALVGLPKRVIVEELEPRNGWARFRLQAFTEGAVGELLGWVAPLLRGRGGDARLGRSEGTFASFGYIESEEPATVEALRGAFRALEARSDEELAVTAWLGSDEPAVRLQLAGLALAVGC